MTPAISAIAFIGLATCIFPLPTNASQPEKADCNNITASAEVDYCVRENLKKSTISLQNAMRRVERNITRDYVADQKLGNELITLIKKTQKAWMTYRDLNCKLDAFEIEKNSPAYTTTVSNCTIRMNDERIKLLEQMYP